jgi:hypothetical protein
MAMSRNFKGWWSIVKDQFAEVDEKLEILQCNHKRLESLQEEDQLEHLDHLKAIEDVLEQRCNNTEDLELLNSGVRVTLVVQVQVARESDGSSFNVATFLVVVVLLHCINHILARR